MSKFQELNSLHFGDNLDVLRATPAESVDLIYLDPPFNSNADYSVLYGTKRGGPSQAQTRAFEDTWKWGKESQRAVDETAKRHLKAGSLLDAFQNVFDGSNMMAYLAMMAVRLIEMKRVLKPNGSLYLHCDPTASHYLRVLLDSIFGIENFRNDIIWKRTTTHSDSKTWSRVADNILFYTKGKSFTWNAPRDAHSEKYIATKYRNDDGDGRRYMLDNMTSPNPRPNMMYEWKGFPFPPKGWRYSRDTMERLDKEGRIWYPVTKDSLLDTSKRPRLKRYLDEMEGGAMGTVWTDIAPVNSQAKERLGYSTQKPLTLLERIILASSNPGDIILDPFCGCGTAVEAAQKLERRWIGIDITYLAIHVIESRLVRAFGPGIKQQYTLHGRPKDAESARALAGRDWLEFQKWAVISLGGLPKDRPGTDGGIDGIIRYHRVGMEQPKRAIVSVKGGLNVGVDAVHKLKSVVEREGAELGVLICVDPPTRSMQKEAASAGEVGTPSRRVSKLQIVPVEMMFQDHPIELPGLLDPPEVGRVSVPIQPKKGQKRIEGQAEMLFAMERPQEGYVSKVKSKPNRAIRVVDVEVTRPNSLKSFTK
jgi:site-specific DNA-methyltransferase (adenine-specific)